MHQYKIVYTEYSEVGALTNISHVAYCDTAEQAHVRYDELNKLYRQGINPSTGEEMQFKAYKVVLQVAAYKTITDVSAFFSQFEI